jgi:hypothetical protein
MPARGADALTPSWEITRSRHFVVHAQGASKEAVDELIRYSEKYYDEVTGTLGLTRFDNFWTWERRANVYLLPDEASYDRFVGQAPWSGGRADVLRREIVTFVGMRQFFDSLLIHEIGHIVFREFVGFHKKTPRWLDEGVATYLEKKHRAERKLVVKAVLDKPQFLTVEDLGRVDHGGAVYPTVYYSEAASIVEFLVAQGGADKFADFCSGLRKLPDEGDWLEVLRRIYGFKDLDALNTAWLKHLKTTE